MPMPMFHPIPPLFFLEDRVTPMMVRMMAENGIAQRRFCSIRAYITLVSPLIFCVAMSPLSWPMLRVSTVFSLTNRSLILRAITVSTLSL